MEKETQDLDFEIEFFEGIVERAPTYEEPLMALGSAYTRRGHYQKGLEVDRRLVELRPSDPVAFYNLACSLSLLKQVDGSLEALQQALQLGYSDFVYIFQDPDLGNLRKDPRFGKILLSRLKK